MRLFDQGQHRVGGVVLIGEVDPSSAGRAAPVIEGARVLTPSPSAVGFAEPPAPWQPAAPRPAITEAETPEERRARFRVISTD